MNTTIYNKINNYKPFDEKEANDKEVMLEYIKNTEDVLTRENKIAHFTASAWITNKERTKILMIYHNIYNSWSWVGGHADGEENLFKVAKKEAEEETGLTNITPLTEDIFGLNIITVFNHIKRGKQVNSHLHFDLAFVFEADEKDLIRIKEDENSGIDWIPIEKVIASSTEENMKPIYQRLLDKMKTL